MKTKYSLPLALLALALAALVMGCEIPDYQLDFSNVLATEYNNTTGYVTVTYTIENYGSKDLSNVKLLIEVMMENGSASATAWTPSYDISSGSSISSTIYVYLGVGPGVLASEMIAYGVKAEWDGE